MEFRLNTTVGAPEREVSLYEFGGSETHVRSLHNHFVPYFKSCSHVLDLGCGRGIFLDLLRENGITGTGVDRAQEASIACRSRGPLSVVEDDIFSFMTGKVDKYDGIFCSHVIEHFGYEDGLRLLQLCYSTLKPNGTFVLITPNCSDLQVSGEIFWLDPTHVRFYPEVLLRRMATLVGFDRIEGGSILGSWKAVPKRDIPAYVVRRLMLGKFYGKPNTYVVARKPLRESTEDRG